MDDNPPIFDQIIALPTWTLNNLMYPFFPPDHLFKRHKTTPTLAMWAKWRTPVVTLFDTALWMCLVSLCIGLLGMWFRSIVGA